MSFERSFEDNLFALQKSLLNKTYHHGGYRSFFVNDPKKRHIHKASVSDRIVHHLLYNYLYNIFDKTFIYDSYSCRLGKGTHKSVRRLSQYIRKFTKNYTRPCFILKCDIKKFFASIDQEILYKLLLEKIKDQDMLWLLRQIIFSFNSEKGKGKGIPLGNLTSQVFANIYLNELDQFIKHNLKIKYYIRYADDFVVLSDQKSELEKLINKIEIFLTSKLKLSLHDKKRTIRNYRHGIDFLGYITLPHIILPRTKTKRRLMKKINEKIENFNYNKITYTSLNQTAQSYLGLLKQSNAYRLSQDLKNKIWFLTNSQPD